MSPVTGKAPIGTLPVDGGATGLFGLNIWECAECFLLTNRPAEHEEWHQGQQDSGAGPQAEPASPNLARHPIGPEVAAGDRVRVLSRPGRGEVGQVGILIGEVLAPGYDLSRLPTAEPAMRVIGVRLDSGQIVDATGWEKL